MALAQLAPGRRRLLSLACGALAGAGAIPIYSGVLAVLPLALAAALSLSAASRKDAFYTGWALGLGYFAVALHWIVEPFFVDAVHHAWMAPFALVCLSGGLGLFWAAAGWLSARLGPSVMLWVAVMSAAELARGYVLTGFPWALPGYLWIDTPVAQLAAWVGPYGLTLLMFAAAGVIAARGRALGLLALWAAALAGLVVLHQTVAPTPVADDAPIVRMVQPNAPQHEKWDPAHIGRFERRLLDASAARPLPDLIVWPETAVPYMLRHAGGVFDDLAQAAPGVPVLLGVQRLEAGRAYNSMALVQDGVVRAVYDKHHLVPFGEYLPMDGLLTRLGFKGLAALDRGSFSAGPGPATMSVNTVGEVLPLVCYEAVFPDEINTVAPRPRAIVHATNDAWFGQFAGPQQHLVQARFRAIEQGVPVLRAANTGISAVIAPDGRVLSQIPLGQDGYLDAALPPVRPETLYRRLTDRAVALILLLFVISSLIGSRRFAD